MKGVAVVFVIAPPSIAFLLLSPQEAHELISTPSASSGGRRSSRNEN
jgi:hypothetical protein